jgi:hypothetical protein
MQKYGIIKADGSLSLNSRQLEGYKPVKYAVIPEFDQPTHFVVQKTPIDNVDEIFVDVEIRELPADLNDGEMNNGFI